MDWNTLSWIRQLPCYLCVAITNKDMALLCFYLHLDFQEKKNPINQQVVFNILRCFAEICHMHLHADDAGTVSCNFKVLAPFSDLIYGRWQKSWRSLWKFSKSFSKAVDSFQNIHISSKWIWRSIFINTGSPVMIRSAVCVTGCHIFVLPLLSANHRL